MRRRDLLKAGVGVAAAVAAPRSLQGQYRARQGTDRRSNAGGRATGSARHSRSGRHDRSSPAAEKT